MLIIFRFLNRKAWGVYSLSAALFLPGILFAAPAQDGAAGPEVSVASVVKRYPSGSIRSVSAAELALADVTKERSVVEAHFAAEQNICYSKFFASSCMEDAKERRRAALEKLRAVEVEANLFLRQARAEKRDQSLAQKREKEETERAERERRAASEAEKRAKAGERSGDISEPQGVPDLDRVARHERKLRQMQAEEAAGAQQRADNIAAYEKKVRQAQERQQEVARRKAEKAREQAGKKNAP